MKTPYFTAYIWVCMTLTAMICVIGNNAAFAQGQGGGGGNKPVLETIVITQNAPLNFGRLVYVFADTVTLTPSGSISSGGGSILSGFPSPASFSVTGEPSTAINISFSNNNTLSGPGQGPRVSNLTHNAGSTPAFDALGNISFDVGGDLTTRNNQAPGAYLGTYRLTVDY